MCRNFLTLCLFFCLVNVVGCGGKNIRYINSQPSENIHTGSRPDSEPNTRTNSQPSGGTLGDNDGFSEDNFESMENSLGDWYSPLLPESEYPEGWKRRTASKDLQVDYRGQKITIRRGERFFTFHNKVVIGWHGTYNPPSGREY